MKFKTETHVVKTVRVAFEDDGLGTNVELQGDGLAVRLDDTRGGDFRNALLFLRPDGLPKKFRITIEEIGE